jgi:3-oxoacyl-[acyl-carrier-protein] synthase-3
MKAMPTALKELTAHLLARVRQVQQRLGQPPAGPAAVGLPFADLLDSMGLVEFLAVLAQDCGMTVTAIEECAGRHFGSVRELAVAMHQAGIVPGPAHAAVPAGPADAPSPAAPAWLAAVTSRLPQTIETAAAIDAALGRRPGWLVRHAGIRARRLWQAEDVLAAAAEAGRGCLAEAGVRVKDVGALVVTSEAPPLLAGLAAALHHHLQLGPQAVALEVGGACTGFLAALWVGQRLLPQAGVVLIAAVEAPSRFLALGPGPAGEAAALFGDGAAACVLSSTPLGPAPLRLAEVLLKADGAAAEVLRVERLPSGQVELRMQGQALAGRAVRAMADMTAELARCRGLAVTDLAAVVAHGGNGRMPGMLARALGLPPQRVWSATPDLGNLGSASLPAAWLTGPPPRGPVAWVAAGAGLTVAGALTERADT